MGRAMNTLFRTVLLWASFAIANSTGVALAANEGPTPIHLPPSGTWSVTGRLSVVEELPPVEVIGRRGGGVTEVCIGACSVLDSRWTSDEIVNYLVGEFNITPEEAKKVAAIVKLSACVIIPNYPANFYNVTGMDTDVYVVTLASQYLDASAMNLRVVDMKGRVFTGRLTDGTELDLRYTSLGSRHTLVGEMRCGSGVAGSDCVGGN